MYGLGFRLRLFLRRRVSRVEEVQVAVDRVPELVFWVAAATAVVSAPLPIPIRVVDLAQVTERGVEFVAYPKALVDG